MAQAMGAGEMAGDLMGDPVGGGMAVRGSNPARSSGRHVLAGEASSTRERIPSPRGTLERWLIGQDGSAPVGFVRGALGTAAIVLGFVAFGLLWAALEVGMRGS
jgi:hypothetical protein